MAQLPPQPLGYMGPAPAPAQAPPRRFGGGLFGWVLFIGIAIMLFMLLSSRQSTFKTVPLSEFMDRLENKQVEWINLEADEIHGHFATPQQMPGGPVSDFVTQLPPGMGSDWAFVQYLLNASKETTEVRVRNPNNYVVNILLPLIPWLLIFGFIWFFVFRQLRRAGQAAAPTQIVVTGPGRWVPAAPQDAVQR